MAPPPDDTSERPDGQVSGDVDPVDPVDPSLGDRSTGADLDSVASQGPRSLGDQSTAGDIGSSVSDLDDLGVGLDDDLEIVDLEARYEFEGELGRGGMGEVLLARDRRLKRQVAIKRLKEELGASRKAAQRFLTEAESVAALNHFNIVQIYDYGRAVDGPFIVMEYVDGGSLAETLAEGRLEQSTAVELIDQLCQALTVTHAQGVIHRDIKPANVLMTRDGVPKLTDFGLARQESVDGGQTRAGAVMGTLDYMPPEQRVDAAKADSRSDLWSLAATFYQLLTGEVPRGLIRPDRLPAELTPVLFKALEQDPAARYQTAEAFREAIHAAEASRPQTSDSGVTIGECSSCGHVSEGDPQYCESCGESLLVPCYSCQSEMKPWVAFCSACGNNIPELLEHRLEELQDQQQQVQALRGEYRHGEALQLLEGMTAETHPQFAPIRKWAQDREPGLRSELQALEERRDAADRAAKVASASHEYEEVIRLLESLPSTVLSDSSRQLLAEAKQRDERSRELYGTIRTSVKEKRKEGLLEQVEEYLALKPGDERVLKLRDQLARRESRQRLEELATQIRQQVGDKQHEGLLPLVEEFLELRPDDERMQQLAETLWAREERSRRQAVTASRQRKWLVRVGVGSGAAVLLLIVIGVAWTARQEADSQRQAADRRQRQVAEQEADRKSLERREPLTLKGHSGSVTSVSFIPDGKRIVSASDDNTVKAWDAQTGQETLTLTGHSELVSSVSFSPDGKRIVSGSYDKTVKVWDAQTGQELLTLERHSDDVNSVSFSPDGKRIVSVSDDKTVKIWDAQTGQETLTLKGHSGYVTSAGFSPDGKRIVSGSFDKTMKVWDAQTGKETLTLKGHTNPVASVSFSPDGKRIVSGSTDKTVKVWDLETVRVIVPTLTTTTTPLLAVAPFDAARAGQHQQAWADHLRTSVETTNSIGMKLRLVPAGELMMGSPATESDRIDNETQHRVTLTKPFYLGVTEVTQEQYQKVMGTNPSEFKGPQNPVERVSWAEAVEFCGKLSAMPAEKTAGHVYRLPTEAEWEYACRAGTTTKYSFGDSASELGDYAWYNANSGDTPHPVGRKKPNAWGLYDMHGNVWEWCQDWFGDYPSGAATDPTGASSGSLRVNRGGSLLDNAGYCRSANRNRDTPEFRIYDRGFRVLRSSIK